MDTEDILNADPIPERRKPGRKPGSKNKVRETVGAAAETPANAVRASQREPERKRTAGGADADQLYVDQSRIPPHMSYEWKRLTYGGKEDIRHQTRLTQHGAWTPVPRKRHPEIVGVNPKDPESPIIFDGLMLMERPKKLTQEAANEDLGNARAQVKGQLDSLRLTPQGNLPRQVNKVSRKYDLPVPEDDAEFS